MAHNTNKARGILGAAAYIANSNDACVRPDSAGTRTCGRMIAAMEKPLATRTLIAVTTEASRNAIIVVIDSSLLVSSSERNWVDLTTCVRATPARSAKALVPSQLALQVELKPSVPCLAQLSSPQLNSGTASNCFSGVSGWNRRGKEFRRHESRATKPPPHRIQLWYLKPNLRQHSLRLLSLLPMHLLLLLR